MITNIQHIQEIKLVSKKAFFGVFKSNVTRYMRSLIKKNSYEKLIESFPLLHQFVNNSNKVKKKVSLQIEINEIEKIAESLSSLVVYAYECKIKEFNKKVFQTFFVIMRMKSAIN